jgi:hypothetical protein
MDKERQSNLFFIRKQITCKQLMCKLHFLRDSLDDFIPIYILDPSGSTFKYAIQQIAGYAESVS